MVIIFVEKRSVVKKGGDMAESICFGAKKGRVGRVNFNLYHYAGNSPVKYVDPDGREDQDLINNETNVATFIETIKNNSNNYSFDVYQRKALCKGKRSPLMVHSLFVITDKSTGDETTLSFNGTKFGLSSTGAWATNTEMDVDSYKSLKKGDNAYDMIHLVSSNMIDSEKTATNILNSISSNISYFAADHMINKTSAENCNTALFSNLAIKQLLPEIPLSKAYKLNMPPRLTIKNGR